MYFFDDPNRDVKYKLRMNPEMLSEYLVDVIQGLANKTKESEDLGLDGVALFYDDIRRLIETPPLTPFSFRTKKSDLLIGIYPLLQEAQAAFSMDDYSAGVNTLEANLKDFRSFVRNKQWAYVPQATLLNHIADFWLDELKKARDVIEDERGQLHVELIGFNRPQILPPDTYFSNSSQMFETTLALAFHYTGFDPFVGSVDLEFQKSDEEITIKELEGNQGLNGYPTAQVCIRQFNIKYKEDGWLKFDMRLNGSESITHSLKVELPRPSGPPINVSENWFVSEQALTTSEDFEHFFTSQENSNIIGRVLPDDGQIAAKIHVLEGLPRTGKTSLIYQLIRKTERHNQEAKGQKKLIPVHLELHEWYRSFKENAPKQKIEPEHLYYELVVESIFVLFQYDLIDTNQRQDLEKDFIEPHEADLAISYKDFESFVKSINKLSLAQASEITFLFLLDDLDYLLNPQEFYDKAQRFWDNFSNLLKNPERGILVVTTNDSEELGLEDLGENEPIQFLSKNELKNFIQSHQSLILSPSAEAFLFQFTGGWQGLVQKTLSLLIQRANQKKVTNEPNNILTLHDLHHVTQDLIHIVLRGKKLGKKHISREIQGIFNAFSKDEIECLKKIKPWIDQDTFCFNPKMMYLGRNGKWVVAQTITAEDDSFLQILQRLKDRQIIEPLSGYGVVRLRVGYLYHISSQLENVD